MSLYHWFQGCITKLEGFFREHFMILAIAGIGLGGIQVSNAHRLTSLIV